MKREKKEMYQDIAVIIISIIIGVYLTCVFGKII